jgi:hypothetical protein
LKIPQINVKHVGNLTYHKNINKYHIINTKFMDTCKCISRVVTLPGAVDAAMAGVTRLMP